jgi:hypothetical protein
MAVAPDTTTGTITLTTGSAAFTTAGVNMLTRAHKPGDTIKRFGLDLVIDTITGENVGTLTEVCPTLPGGVSGNPTPVRIRFQPDGSRVPAQARALIDAVGDMVTRFSPADVANASTIDLYEATANGANKLTLRPAAALGADRIFTFPDVDYDHVADLFARYTRATAAGAASLDLREDTDNGTSRVRVQAPAALGADRIFTLPDADVAMHAFAAQYLAAADAAAVRDALAAGGVIRFQHFTSSGLYTPHAKMLFCIAGALGSGAAGGGSAGAAGHFVAGGGGASGGFSLGFFSKADIGVNKAVTIPAGGAGVSGSTGGSGGVTSLGSLLTANGGNGGGPATSGGPSGVGGVGAAPGTGSLAMRGNTGDNGMYSSIITLYRASGNGAPSALAGGARGNEPAGSSSVAGTAAAANTGAGGSGSLTYNQASNGTGGPGGSGYLFIFEICSA